MKKEVNRRIVSSGASSISKNQRKEIIHQIGTALSTVFADSGGKPAKVENKKLVTAE